MTGKTLIFTGAPEKDFVEGDSGNFLDTLQGSLARFVVPPSPARTDASLALPRSSTDRAVWRSVPLERTHLQTGFSQQHAFALETQPPQGSPHFLVTTTLSFTSTSTESAEGDVPRNVLSEFYEHSLAIHDDIPSSQLLASTKGTQEQTTSFGTNETTSFLSSVESRDQPAKEPLGNHGDGHLSDLEDIPPPSYLTSIQPQTMTVNLIVGVISIAAPRTIRTRWGSDKTLVEVLVGDDTKSGFTITFWVPSDDVGQSVLAGLRSQDVILVQNVALTVFMNKVYGSSLRKDLTRVHLLYRRKLDRNDTGGYYNSTDLIATGPSHPQLQKTTKVKEWVLEFVGQAEKNSKGRNITTQYAWNQPPPHDTQ